ncbi:MAG: hypothetical protein ACTHMS_04870 [Jatrophihabitans sp.]|uniref:hypothetical protein n=1 Tax=Jatrophihabitans sp. TaxID=1932789 RepID=UPI003F7EF90D
MDLSGYATFESFCAAVQFTRNLLDPNEAFVFIMGGYEGVRGQNGGTTSLATLTTCSSSPQFMDALSSRDSNWNVWMNNGSARVTSISVPINGLPPVKVY